MGPFTANDVEQFESEEEYQHENTDESKMNKSGASRGTDGDHANVDSDADGDGDDVKGLVDAPLTRADKTIEELLSILSEPDFSPIIPDAVTDFYLSKHGLKADPSLRRLMALATQKFISDIATDAYEHSRIRSNSAIHNANNPQTRSRALLNATIANAKGDSAAGEEEEGATGTSLGNQGKEKVSLTIHDLSSALDEYGLNVNRPQFYR